MLSRKRKISEKAFFIDFTSTCKGTHTKRAEHSVLSAKHTMHTISNNTIPLTYKSLITSSTLFYESHPDPVRCAASTFIFPRTKYSGFYLGFNKARQQIRFITETEVRQLWRIQPWEPFVLPAGTGCRMNLDLWITHAFKPRKLITDTYGPQLSGLTGVTEEDESCGRATRTPCWACSICVIKIYVLWGCTRLSEFFPVNSNLAVKYEYSTILFFFFQFSAPH